MKQRLAKMAAVGVLIAAPACRAAPADQIVSAAADRHGVAVTIYNDNLALVKDDRRVRLARGFNQLAWREVAAQMQAETAQLRSVANPGRLRLLEQNFNYDPLTPETLLEKYVGHQVKVIRTNQATGAETREAATVLSARGGVVLRFADRIETGVPGRLAFPDVPDSLRDRPTLVVALDSSAAGAQDLELSYLTGGLSWRADYVAQLEAGDAALDLNGWVTLMNQSGTDYPDARLQLVAGELNRVREAPPREAMAMAAKAAGGPEPQQEALFEYHLYTLARPTTLAQNQTKQVALLAATRVPVRKEYVLQGANYYYSGRYGELGRKVGVGVYVEFDNKGEGLGIPLPKGVIRVYTRDSQGGAQFVGEDRIGHTPKGKTVRLRLGDAFDLTAERKQTDFQKLAGTARYNYVFESAFEIVLKNARQEAATVTVREPIPGDWSVVSESLPHAKAASDVAEWKVPVPGGGEAKLAYRVRVRY